MPRTRRKQAPPPDQAGAQLPIALETKLESFVGQQFEQLRRAIADTVEENSSLRSNLSEPDRSFEELQGTLELFGQFAATYYLSILALVSSKDYTRLSKALQKIQHEVFVLRRLVEQRESANLQPLLQVADRWCNTYLDRLIKENTAQQDPHAYGSIQRAPVVIGDTEVNGAAGAAGAPTLRNRYRNWGLVFFESEHLIRQGRFAYNRNPTIALPLVHAYQPWNWMGMAHEIGHFVFNNMEISLDPPAGTLEPIWMPLAQHVRQSVFRSLADKYLLSASTPHDQSCMGIANSIPLWCTWSDELFADLLGAVTLGPAYVESLILYIGPTLDGDEALLKDDGDHPCNCLRPVLQLLVHIKLLEAEGEIDSDLKQELAAAAGLWFSFCESHFHADEWPQEAGTIAAGLDLGSSRGILDRLAVWGTYVKRTVGRVPLKVLLQQIPAVIDPYVKVLSALPLYDAVAHKLAHKLADSPQILNQVGEVHTEVQRRALAAQFVLFLPSQWYRQAATRAERFAVGEPQQWQHTAKKVSQLLGFEEARNSTSVKQAAIGGPETVDKLIKPLFERSDDDDKQRRMQILEAAWRPPYSPTQESRELADWLLSIQFATESPYSGYVNCGVNQTPGCV